MSDGPDPIGQLISKFQSGQDREEISRLIFQRFYGPIRRFFQRRGFSEDESYDLAQDAFVQIFKSLDSFQGRSGFEAWIYGVISNVYNNELRRRWAQKREVVTLSLDAPLYEDGLPLHDYLPLATEEAEPLARTLEKERHKALGSALQALPPQMRVCCQLRYEQGLKYQEIATVLGVSIETVKAHLFQARKRLAEVLRKNS